MPVPAGTWVEVERILLEPDQRSTALPDETRSTPYVFKLSGFLTTDAEVGDDVVVRSMIGREHRGRLARVNPSYAHTFGETVPELLPIGLPGDPSLPSFDASPDGAATTKDPSRVLAEESSPLVERADESSPLVERADESFPLVERGDESFPLVERADESFPLVERAERVEATGEDQR